MRVAVHRPEHLGDVQLPAAWLRVPRPTNLYGVPTTVMVPLITPLRDIVPTVLPPEITPLVM